MDTYPDVPGQRVVYDTDGTTGVFTTGTSVTATMSAAQVTALNNEAYSDFGNQSYEGDWYCLIFPRLLDFVGIMVATKNDSTPEFQWSPDTTNGVDGTWTSVAITTAVYSRTALRTNIAPLSLTGVRSIRTRDTGFDPRVSNIHLFGTPSAGEDLQRVAVWHSELDQRLGPASLDWGDAIQGSQEVRQFRVKNLHPTLTAQGVTVTREALTDTAFRDAMDLSDDGSIFGISVAVGDLGPGQISPVLHVRRSYTSTEPLSVRWARLRVSPTGWI